MCNFNMLSYIFPEILPFLFDSSERGEWDSFILVIIYFDFLSSPPTPVPRSPPSYILHHYKLRERRPSRSPALEISESESGPVPTVLTNTNILSCLSLKRVKIRVTVRAWRSCPIFLKEAVRLCFLPETSRFIALSSICLL